ncbi:MAG: DinB family protein [Dehalococcoidia bacterium]|nr:DinB family protein [Dehalococcoidia bacterium]
MVQNRTELLQHYAASRRELLGAIAGLSDAQLMERSLDGWSVKDHLAHLAAWDEIRAAEVRRISAGHDSAWRMTEEQGDAYNALAYDLRRELPLEQARWELEASRAQLLDAVSSATERGLDEALYGEAGLRSVHEEEHTGWIREWRARQGL